MPSPNLKKRLIDLLALGQSTTGAPGFPDLATDASLVGYIYANADYTPAQLLQIQTWFAAHPVSIKGEYNRSIKELPCVVVQRTGDGEAPGGNLGDQMGFGSETATESTFVRGVRTKEQFKLTIYAHSGTDLRDALYLAVRQFILQGRFYLENEASGIDFVLFTSGRDSDGENWGDKEKPLIVHTAELYLEAATKTTWLATENKLTGCTSTSTFKQWRDER